MPFVHVHWFEGRTDEQKAEIAKRIEEALVEVAGAAPEHCWVKFSDSSKPTSSSARQPSSHFPRSGLEEAGFFQPFFDPRAQGAGEGRR